MGAKGAGDAGAPRSAHEALARVGLVDQAKPGPRLVRHRNEDAPGGRATDIAAGSVNGIKHPGQPRGAVLGAKFLAEDTVFGARLGQECAHRLFRGAVGHGHGIEIRAFAFSRQIRLPEVAQGFDACGIGQSLGQRPQRR